MTSKRKLFRYAASLIFATRQGYGYTAAKDSTISLASLQHRSQQQRIAQMSPHVIQQLGTGHVKGVDVLFVQRATESGFMVCVCCVHLLVRISMDSQSCAFQGGCFRLINTRGAYGPLYCFIINCYPTGNL